MDKSLVHSSRHGFCKKISTQTALIKVVAAETGISSDRYESVMAPSLHSLSINISYSELQVDTKHWSCRIPDK